MGLPFLQGVGLNRIASYILDVRLKVTDYIIWLDGRKSKPFDIGSRGRFCYSFSFVGYNV